MLSIGKITGFHGLNGEVKLPYSERLEKNLSVMKSVFLITASNASETLEIEYFKVSNKNILLKFKKYSSRTDAEHLHGAILKQDKDLLAPLEEEEYFISDLIGLKVYDQKENLIGTVNSILSNASSNDIIEIKLIDNKLKLVPFVDELVPFVSIEENKVIINPIPGLLDDDL